MEALLARLQLLEDRADIADLIAQFGPAVDALEGDRLGALWAPDGGYLVGDEFALWGTEVRALTELPAHQAYVARGCGHVLSAPTIRVTGDTATAVNYSMVVLREGDGWGVERLSANRWKMERASGGWRVTLRENHLLDGNASARQMLSE